MAFPLSETFTQQLEAFAEALHVPNQRACLVGPHGAGLAFVLSYVMHAWSPVSSRDRSHLKSQDDSNPLARSCLLVLPTEEDANDLYQDLQFCHSLLDVSSDSLLFFPQRGDVPYEPMAPSIDLVAQRMQTLCQLVERRPFCCRDLGSSCSAEAHAMFRLFECHARGKSWCGFRTGDDAHTVASPWISTGIGCGNTWRV